jgi:hypothetical protein
MSERDDWDDWRIHVLAELERLSGAIERLIDAHADIKGQIAQLASKEDVRDVQGDVQTVKDRLPELASQKRVRDVEDDVQAVKTDILVIKTKAAAYGGFVGFLVSYAPGFVQKILGGEGGA